MKSMLVEVKMLMGVEMLVEVNMLGKMMVEMLFFILVFQVRGKEEDIIKRCTW